MNGDTYYEWITYLIKVRAAPFDSLKVKQTTISKRKKKVFFLTRTTWNWSVSLSKGQHLKRKSVMFQTYAIECVSKLLEASNVYSSMSYLHERCQWMLAGRQTTHITQKQSPHIYGLRHLFYIYFFIR